MSEQVRIEMRSNPHLLCGIRELLACIAGRLGFSEEACTQIKLAADEALCNVIRHGYDRHADRPIWIVVSTEPAREGDAGDALRIVIEDEARQVEPASIKSRNLEDVRPGGLGVHIIREVMDEVVYEKRPTTGMRLTMLKRRRAGGQRAACADQACGCEPAPPKPSPCPPSSTNPARSDPGWGPGVRP